MVAVKPCVPPSTTVCCAEGLKVAVIGVMVNACDLLICGAASAVTVTVAPLLHPLGIGAVGVKLLLVPVAEASVPQFAGLSDQFSVLSLVPLLLSTAVIAPEAEPSSTAVEAGEVSAMASGFTVNVTFLLIFPLTVEAAVMVAVQELLSSGAVGGV